MTASLSGVFSLQEFTDTGTLGVGYRLYTYTSGTTTQKTAYTDAAGTIPHTYTSDGLGGQYIALNARGELPAPLFLTSGAYDICLKTSAGVTVWTRYASPIADGTDSITAALASSANGSGADLVGGSGRVVSTTSAVRALSKTGIGRAFALGYSAPGDGGGGQYYYDSTDTSSTDNGGTILVAGDGGRWKLSFTGMLSICQWGVLPTNTAAQNATALTAALNWAIPRGHTLWWPEVNIPCNAVSVSDSTAQGVRIKCAGKGKSRVNYSGIGTASWLTITGTSGTLAFAAIEGLGFDGATTTTAVELRGICGQEIRDCEFGVNALAVLYNNFSTGQFTEYCVVRRSNFATGCLRWIEYKITSGNASFHGSGMSDRCLCNTPSSAYTNLITVGANCYVYNAPLDIHVWTNAAGTMLQNNNTGTPSIWNCNWSGQITLEPFAGTITLASGYSRTFFSGPIRASGSTFALGTLRLVRDLTGNADGSFSASMENYEKSFSSVTTGTALNIDSSFWPNGAIGSMLLHVTLVGANYRYTHILIATLASGIGGSNTVTQIAAQQAFNTAGWGASTFSLDGSGNLVVTNAAGGFSVGISVGVSQLGGALVN